VSAAERPHRSELVDRCECGTEIDHRGECTNLDCVEYETAVHGPIRYEVQLPWGRIPCATLRRAIDLRAGQAWSRIVRADYVPVDEDDDWLNELEREAIEAPDGAGRDVLIAVIDGIAAQAA
jgi:hypothetical protein